MKKDLYLTIDVGGTKISFALFSGKGRLLAYRKIPTFSSRSPGPQLDRLHKEGRLLASGWGRIKRIALACPGPFDFRTGKALRLPNLRTWRGVNLKRELEKRFGVKILFENDANLAALGEASRGAGKGYRNIAYITFSTGIGGGFVSDGTIFRGASMDAFEIGHMTVAKDGPVCGCGKRGCLEALSSGSAMARKAKKLAPIVRSSYLYRIMKRGAPLNAEAIMEGVRKGDTLSKKIWKEALDYFSMGVANIIHVVNPDIIVIGGGISNGWREITAHLKPALEKYAWPRPLKNCRIAKAKLSGMAAHWGGFKLLSDG